MSKLIVNFYQNKPDYSGIYQDNKTKKLGLGSVILVHAGKKLALTSLTLNL